MLHVVDYMMAHQSQEKTTIGWDCMFALLSELYSRAISFFNSKGASSSISSLRIVNSSHGKKLCNGIYAFHEPTKPIDVEIVFIHGLEFDGSQEAYWKTWLARDGTQDNCWPKTWLVEKFPRARILSLSYDAHIVQTPTLGRMDPYSLGESLIEEMTLGGIGQLDCPVVFVCHSFGGLIAKQIVVIAHRKLYGKKEYENLLRNLRAFYFYATPHGGVQVDLTSWNPFTSKGPCMSYLEVFSLEVGRLNDEFEQIYREAYNSEWMRYNVGESHATWHGKVVVPESSARQFGDHFVTLDAGHFDICKPKSKEDLGYLKLIDYVSKVIKVHKAKQHHLMDLPNGLVGMDDMTNSICQKLHTTSIIGVVGMGGIGKTTISKYVYNSQAKFYDKACYLQDVRSRDLTFVQKQLLEELCGEQVDNIDCLNSNHFGKIKQCIMGRRVLLVIDDVEKTETLNALQVPTFEGSLSSRSRVIVTCRNRQVVENHISKERLKDVEIVDVKFLNEDQASKLFWYHTFCGMEDESDEMENFQGLAKDIVKKCCGLPLSLEVIGQHLRKQHRYCIEVRKEIWEEALEKLCEAKSFDGGDENEVLWRKLKISYDDLDNDTKSKFLDFACLFCEKSTYDLCERSIGWIWKSPTVVQNLLARSLIKVDGFNRQDRCLTIHDQLRDMGRRIVKDMALKNICVSLRSMTRLWEANEIESFLEDNQRCQDSSDIEGISFQKCLTLSTSQLQVNVKLKQDTTIRFFPKLRLLNLEKCRCEVVEFCLRECGKELSWLCLEGIHDMVMPQSIEAIAFCTHLRVLQIRSCYKLKELPTSIGNLVCLIELEISYYCSLQSLPHEIGNLKQLKRLELQGCSKLMEVPTSTSQLIKLEYLGLNRCSNLVNMLEFGSQMDHLHELYLCGCGSLQIPFKSLGKLCQLRILEFKNSINLVIENPFESFGRLSLLEKLNLNQCCDFISGFSCDFYSRKNIARMWDPVIQSFSFRLQELYIPSISPVGFPLWPKLKVLEFHNGFHLEELPASLGDLTQLERLTIWDSYNGCLKKLPNSLASLVKLENLGLNSMNAMDRLPDLLGHLCSLKTLRIDHAEKIEELPTSMGQLSQLKNLRLVGCVNLRRLPMSFKHLTQLSYLNLYGCVKLELMDIDQEALLQELKQYGCYIHYGVNDSS